MVAGREIKRSQSLRGTRAFRARNWFIFITMSVNLVLGAGIAYMCRGQMNKLLEKNEEERKFERERIDRIKEILEHRQKDAAQQEPK